VRGLWACSRMRSGDMVDSARPQATKGASSRTWCRRARPRSRPEPGTWFVALNASGERPQPVQRERRNDPAWPGAKVDVIRDSKTRTFEVSSRSDPKTAHQRSQAHRTAGNRPWRLLGSLQLRQAQAARDRPGSSPTCSDCRARPRARAGRVDPEVTDRVPPSISTEGDRSLEEGRHASWVERASATYVTVS